MGTVRVHAGDFLKGDGQFSFGAFQLRTKEHSFVGENIHATELVALDVATEDSVISVGGALGWGLVGAALLGPVGLIGAVLGGKKKEVTFVAQFKNGRRLFATCDHDDFVLMKAAMFGPPLPAAAGPSNPAPRSGGRKNCSNCGAPTSLSDQACAACGAPC